MSLVGPRPLPINEERKIPRKWQIKRRGIKPGIACSWLLKGAHYLSFKQWMKLDLKDTKESNLLYDLSVFLRTILLGFRLVKDELKRKNHFPFSK